MADPVYSSTWELVEDTLDYEYRNKTTAVLGANLIVSTSAQRREVRTKVYQATILDGSNELPAPSYQAGDSHIDANPENLSPVGNGADKWHCDGVHYAKSLSQPLSRSVRVTWVKRSSWATYEQEN